MSLLLQINGVIGHPHLDLTLDRSRADPGVFRLAAIFMPDVREFRRDVVGASASDVDSFQRSLLVSKVSLV
jgi:hypothetical protein